MSHTQVAPQSWETICDYQSEDGPAVTHARGLLLASSLTILREMGYYERYLRLLPKHWHEPVLLTNALSWAPIELMVAHYQACDELCLTERQLTLVGDMIAARFGNTFLGTLARTSRNAGLEAPWLALRSAPRVWNRVFMGGGLKLFRTGMKDIAGEITGLPLATSAYYRAASYGYYRGISSLFVRRIHLALARTRVQRADALVFRGSWV